MTSYLDEDLKEKGRIVAHRLGRLAVVLLAICVAVLVIPGRGRTWLKAYLDQQSDPAEPEVPETEEDLSDEELSGIRPNELGSVMIVMYHDIQDQEKEWVRSRENFRADLQRFYELGYSLVPLNAFLTGEMDVPPGRAPLVLTFDDGTSGQFRFAENDQGELIPDPDCAVGILLEFAQEHTDFGHAATFFVNFPAPFGRPSHVDQKLAFLLDNGMEIGNHTYSHRNLSRVSPVVVAEEIGKLANEIKGLCGYDMRSLALPYGGYPGSARNLDCGEYDGQEYCNLGVLLVGAEPAPSPYSKKLDPLALPRIRGSQQELDKWLAYFEKYPERRFVSDGRTDTVTVRSGEEFMLDGQRTCNLRIETYTPCAEDD